MKEFPFHIVKLTLKKSGTIIHLFYHRKNYQLKGYSFIDEPLEFHVLLDIMKQFFPPNFEAIGGFNIKHHLRVSYDLLTWENNNEKYQELQQALEFK